MAELVVRTRGMNCLKSELVLPPTPEFITRCYHIFLMQNISVTHMERDPRMTLKETFLAISIELGKKIHFKCEQIALRY